MNAIFGNEPRKDILHRMVRYQLAKRQGGNHQVQERGDVKKTTKRIGNQKGGGTARLALAHVRTLLLCLKRFALWLCVMRYPLKRAHQSLSSLMRLCLSRLKRLTFASHLKKWAL